MLMLTANNNSQKNVDPNDIRPDEYIEVLSLIPFRLTLTTEARGGGKAYTFDNGIGDKKRILYRDLVDIIDVQQGFLKIGYFYILDKRVINRHGLADVYDGILNKEKMEEILACETPAIIEIFKGATKKQQEIIGLILAQKVSEGEYVDLNIISQLEKIGKISIIRRADDIKELQSISE
jgi:hypothetical protein